jgi:hypothetical protein
MFLWHASRAAAALRTRQLSERDKFDHLIAASALQFLVARYALLVRGQTVAGVVIVLALFGITVWGIARAFRLNQMGDGVQFLERYVVLAVPLTIQFYAVYAVLVVLGYLLVPAPADQPQALRYAYWLSYAIALMWLYRRMGRLIAHAATTPGFDAVAR